MNDQTKHTVPDDVMDKLAKELAVDTSDIPEQGEAFFAKARQVDIVSRRGPTDIERLMETGSRLLKTKIEERIRAISEYERHRVELMDGYRVQMERLRNEADDAVRHLVANHDKRMAALDSIITKLTALRGS